MLRALVACGWFGIQTWIGGQAIHSMAAILSPGFAASPSSIWICFFAFWLINIAIIWRGIETIRFLEATSAPFMIAVGLLLLLWITDKAGGFGPAIRLTGDVRRDMDRIRAFYAPIRGKYHASTGTIALAEELTAAPPEGGDGAPSDVARPTTSVPTRPLSS